MERVPEPEYMDDADEARAYAETDFSEVNTAFVARLVELAPKRDAARVIDLGCGPGDIPLRIARARRAWHVTGFDASYAMLTFARADAVAEDAQASWVLGDVKRCPFADDRFDIVCSNSILHHVNDTPALWGELRRIACPGAFVFLRDLFRPDNPEAARALVDTYAADATDLLREEFYRSFLAAYTPAEVRAQLVDTGLDTLNVEAVTDRHMDIWGPLP